MNKILLCFLSGLVVLGLGACGSSSDKGYDVNQLAIEATARMLVQHPDARLMEGDAPVADLGTDASDVTTWTFAYNYGDQMSNGASITFTDGKWGSIVEQGGPIFEDIVIDLPLARSLDNAISLMRDAGYTEPFSYVTLRQPLSQSITEPSYIFTVPDRGVFVFVGINSGEVTTEDITGK